MRGMIFVVLVLAGVAAGQATRPVSRPTTAEAVAAGVARGVRLDTLKLEAEMYRLRDAAAKARMDAAARVEASPEFKAAVADMDAKAKVRDSPDVRRSPEARRQAERAVDEAVRKTDLLRMDAITGDPVANELIRQRNEAQLAYEQAVVINRLIREGATRPATTRAATGPAARRSVFGY